MRPLKHATQDKGSYVAIGVSYMTPGFKGSYVAVQPKLEGPRSGEALEGAIRVAAPLGYANEASIYLPDSHFLKLPDLFGPLRRNVNPSPPDSATCQWLRSNAPRLSQRDEGDKSSIPPGLYAFFCGDISIANIVKLIRARKTADLKMVQQMRATYRSNRAVFKIPRQAHLKQALLEKAAKATPPVPLIAPLPEGFSLEAPPASPSQSNQPSSTRVKAPKRPAPEGSASSAPQLVAV